MDRGLNGMVTHPNFNRLGGNGMLKVVETSLGTVDKFERLRNSSQRVPGSRRCELAFVTGAEELGNLSLKSLQASTRRGAADLLTDFFWAYRRMQFGRR